MLQVVTDAQVNSCRDAVQLQTARIDVGLIFYFAIASLAVYGTTLAGWASYNKWSLLGGLRASSQMMSYESDDGPRHPRRLPRLRHARAERDGAAQGPNPIDWGIVKQPLGAVLFFTAAMAETKRTPFDLPEGENEVIGYFVEYSGMRFGIFFLAEFIEVVFLSAIMATVFFGGWQVPFSTPTASTSARTCGSCRTSSSSSCRRGVGPQGDHRLLFQLLVRWTIRAFRPDQLMSLGWKRLLPVSLANILITAVVVLAIQAWELTRWKVHSRSARRRPASPCAAAGDAVEGDVAAGAGQRAGVTMRHFFTNIATAKTSRRSNIRGEGALPGALSRLHRLMLRDDGSVRCVACMCCRRRARPTASPSSPKRRAIRTRSGRRSSRSTSCAAWCAALRRGLPVRRHPHGHRHPRAPTERRFEAVLGKTDLMSRGAQSIATQGGKGDWRDTEKTP